jgi:putative YpdA family bacillithiol system oxidoreductase
MDPTGMDWALYAMPLLLILAVYLRNKQRQHAESVEVLEENLAAGLAEPASLHPSIDPNKCIGCGSCVTACPEMPGHQVLGMVHRKATLVGPTDCIGHGACRAACPVDAITLVFGSERRGVDIPHVKPNFETNVPGIFIAGELGGMGLIRNAIEQGRQAMESIAAKRSGRSADIDVVIVGAGPSGIAASLTAQQRGLRYVTLEQDSLGGTVASFPRRKLVMTSPAELPLVGKVKFSETTKEALMEFWREVERKTGLRVNYGERVTGVDRRADGFTIKTTRAQYSARALLLAVGRRGTPRKLGVPGEDGSKVTYRLIDPAQYRGQHVLVVGGGDSALESALALGEEAGATVSLSYRSAAFSRAKKKNRERLEAAAEAGRVAVYMESNVERIEPEHVVLGQRGKQLRLRNDAVIVNAGGILPTEFLKEIGIEVQTKYGTA